MPSRRSREPRPGSRHRESGCSGIARQCPGGVNQPRRPSAHAALLARRGADPRSAGPVDIACSRLGRFRNEAAVARFNDVKLLENPVSGRTRHRFSSRGDCRLDRALPIAVARSRTCRVSICMSGRTIEDVPPRSRLLAMRSLRRPSTLLAHVAERRFHLRRVDAVPPDAAASAEAPADADRNDSADSWVRADSLFADRARRNPARRQPLATRLLPRTLDGIVGQDHLLGPGAPLRLLIEADRVSSLVLRGWFPTSERQLPICTPNAHSRRWIQAWTGHDG